MNNNITNLVTEKRNQLPKRKIDITKDNLVVPKNLINLKDTDENSKILLTEDDDIESC